MKFEDALDRYLRHRFTEGKAGNPFWPMCVAKKRLTG
jgi:hypothetical protein